jgi:uncharacterized protein with HEPN domain
VTPGPESDRVLLVHMRECLDRIHEYTGSDHTRFDASHLVQDAVIRNLQTLTNPANACQTRSNAQSHRSHGASLPASAM